MNDLSSYPQTKSKQYSVKTAVQIHVKLVKQIAYHLLACLPNSVQLDDLVQAGVIGLIEAAQRYDSSREASFTTFASIRIRGVMCQHFSGQIFN